MTCLGMLAEVYRNRGCHAKAHQVADICIKRLEGMELGVVARHPTEAMKVNHSNIGFKINQIKVNVCTTEFMAQLPLDPSSPILLEMIAPFRALCLYEIDYVSPDQRASCQLFDNFVDVADPKAELCKVTDAELSKLLCGSFETSISMRSRTDADVASYLNCPTAPKGDLRKQYLECIQSNRDIERREASLRKSAALRSCEQCKKQESMRGEYKKCGGCSDVFYCSRECQKASWVRSSL